MRRFLVGLAVAASLTLSGCSSGGSMFSGGGWFGGGTSTPAEPPVPGAAAPSAAHSALFGPQVTPTATTFNPDLCPRIEVRDGSNLWRQGGNGPTELRYQATITDLARECLLEGGNLRVRVGVEGRVLVGPKGGAGTATLPIRIAMTRGLSDPVWTRLYQVPIQIPAGAPNVAFTQVEDNLVIPLPSPGDATRLIIFVGFDTLARPQPERRGRQARQ